ncbi:hypothetical protein CHU93_03045 [Sandarakinorhabdus cyanobacteriorum]|uniref:SnoaL-like domain-containing protein n=1 Tax=Sandarakinorhabdus cyanobacteriorum TaxID=1981098 RepID=A0A255YX35_9SPHN|nr:nuclear transport factor 2 family protein [Sandarakinorhabdus cyanobacteriorum]OYQ33225.1 hypothetical protein CHU93_03045 [Sandarakinorhabdus cyanobacteriorum]
MLEQFQAWVTAFDACVADDDWQRLVPMLADDVAYLVTGVPFGCDLRGRDAVLAGFARSIANFDRQFDERQWFGVGWRAAGPCLAGRAMGVYRRAGAPVLSFSAREQLHLRDDGRIGLIVDVYDLAELDNQLAMAWLASHGAGLDPSYG